MNRMTDNRFDHRAVGNTFDECVDNSPLGYMGVSTPEEGFAEAPLIVGTSTRPSVRVANLVVIDESGYLVPVFTAADLLCECKIIWRGTS